MHTRNWAKLTIPTPEGYVFIMQDNILFCQSDGNYTIFFLQEGRMICSKKLKEIELYLSPENFIRTHQSYLVNLRHVEKYYRKNNGQLVLFNGKIIPISRSRKEEVLARINVI